MASVSCGHKVAVRSALNLWYVTMALATRCLSLVQH